jgi:hypothetical protein
MRENGDGLFSNLIGPSSDETRRPTFPLQVIDRALEGLEVRSALQGLINPTAKPKPAYCTIAEPR